MPSTTPGSAPTEIGGILVEPLPASDPAIAIVPTAPSEDTSARTQVQGGAPSPELIEPAPPIVAAARSALLEIEIAEPTDISHGPPEPMADLQPRETRELPPLQTIELPAPDAVEPEPPEAGEPSPTDEPLLRKTVVGFAPVPSQNAAAEEPTGNDGVLVGSPPEPRFQPALDEATPSEGWTMPVDHQVWPGAIQPLAPPSREAPLPRETVSLRKARPLPDATSTSETLPPSNTLPPGDTLPPTSTLPPKAPDSAPAEPPSLSSLSNLSAGSPPTGAAGALPSGDWLIARDPDAPDGWSAPLQTITPAPYADGRLAPVPVIANAQLLDSEPRGSTLRPDEIAIEPKVQIDPTLIEPIPIQPIPMQPIPEQTMPGMVVPLDDRLRPMPPDGSLQPTPLENPFVDAAVSSPGLPEYSVPPPPGAIEAPPMNMRMAVAQSSPFLMQQVQPMHAPSATAYPGPGYPMAAGRDYQMPAMMGLHDPRYPSDAALPVQAGQRRVIIVLVSALVAAVIGIVVLLALGDSRDASAPSGSDVPHRRRSSVEPPTPPASTAPAQPPSSPTPGSAPETAAPASPPGAPPAAAAAIAAPPAAGACFADVSSVPTGAEILIDQTRVIGTTPQKVALPCGKPVDLVIRKARLVAVTRTVTPTPQGARLRVALAKPTLLVKVSSTPAGATITLNGRSLGVTPTTVKVPAFESSILMIVKDGYATETEAVAPKSNGLTVHADLKRLDRKKPW